LSVYGVTKAAVRSFARSWTVELKDRKIRVNALSPGPIATQARSGWPEERVEQFKKSVPSSVPLGRVGNPDEIAKAVAFLASDDSSYITGVELFIDGGLSQVSYNSALLLTSSKLLIRRKWWCSVRHLT
jgi:NAD(P)-dependent dehydrogenase (short-subunit alcohol dehydrogenase family)